MYIFTSLITSTGRLRVAIISMLTWTPRRDLALTQAWSGYWPVGATITPFLFRLPFVLLIKCKSRRCEICMTPLHFCLFPVPRFFLPPPINLRRHGLERFLHGSCPVRARRIKYNLFLVCRGVGCRASGFEQLAVGLEYGCYNAFRSGHA